MKIQEIQELKPNYQAQWQKYWEKIDRKREHGEIPRSIFGKHIVNYETEVEGVIGRVKLT